MHNNAVMETHSPVTVHLFLVGGSPHPLNAEHPVAQHIVGR